MRFVNLVDPQFDGRDAVCPLNNFEPCRSDCAWLIKTTSYPINAYKCGHIFIDEGYCRLYKERELDNE